MKKFKNRPNQYMEMHSYIKLRLDSEPIQKYSSINSNNVSVISVNRRSSSKQNSMIKSPILKSIGSPLRKSKYSNSKLNTIV